MRHRAISLALLSLAAAAMPARAAEWSAEASVRDGAKTILKFRARLSGDFVIVEAVHEPGWHSYAMDNELRATEKLAGRPSLGIEQGVRISVESGGKTVGQWYQSTPHDLSQPELQWFTWGFDGTATFACRLARSGAGPVTLKIGGQVCDGRSCRPIAIELKPTPPGVEPKSAFSTEGLVQVRTETKADPSRSSHSETHP